MFHKQIKTHLRRPDPISLHLTACVLGLSTLLHMSAVAFQTLKYVGVVYLFYLAWSMWRETGAIDFEKSVQRKGIIQIANRGFLINILNPKLSVFFLAFLPQFISTNRGISPTAQLLYFSGMFMGMTLIVFVLYGISSHSVRTHFVSSPKRIVWIQRSFAAVFASLGVKLAISEQ